MDQDDVLAVALARNLLWPGRHDRTLVVGAVPVLPGAGDVSDSVLIGRSGETAEGQFQQGADGFCLDLTEVTAQLGQLAADGARGLHSEHGKVESRREHTVAHTVAHTDAQALLSEIIGDLAGRYSLPIAVLGAPSSWQAFCWGAGASMILTGSRIPGESESRPTLNAPQLSVLDLRARPHDRHERSSDSGTENPTDGREGSCGPRDDRDWECAAASVALNSVALESVPLDSGERRIGPLLSGMKILICTEVSAVRRVVDMFAAIQAHREAPEGTEAKQ
jgi:hypothetical protein